MSKKMLAVFTVAASFGLSASAYANGWHICNHTPEELSVAIAYKDRQEQWVSKGWHNLNACGGCAFVMDHSRTEYVDVYYHARSNSGEDRISGNTRFCVSHGGPFTHISRSGEHCPTAGFRHVNIDTTGNFTSHIRGSVGGRHCID